uniref:Phospholipase A2 inhibitor and Ly6/PLAUR domain-containing protein-like n=1 Tax=Chelonoidis abingdonii TaxID=106734 RepID=A0A8C0G175_CHEAB
MSHGCCCAEGSYGVGVEGELISFFSSYAVGMKQQIIIKGCATSSNCTAGPLTMNFGNRVTIRSGTTCCMGDACRTTTVTVPPANTRPNGRRCPACISVLYAQCNEETIQCTGADTRCIEVAGTVTFGNFRSFTLRLFFLCCLFWSQFRASLCSSAVISGAPALRSSLPVYNTIKSLLARDTKILLPVKG